MQLGNGTSHRRATIQAAVGTAAVLIGLTGCTGSTPTAPPSSGGTTSEAPVTTPTPTPSPTPTVDLTVPPVRPEAMATPSADGAAAAATYFTQLYAYAYATGDLTEWKAMSEPDCQFCNSVIDDITSMVAEGGSESSATIVVKEAVGMQIDPDFYSASLRMQQGASTRFDSAGNVVTAGVARTYELLFALAWRDGWFVRQIDTTTLDETPAP